MGDDIRENFFAKVEKKDGKWHWTGSVNNDGYPKMKDHGKLRLASHLSLELAGRSAPPKGKVVMHEDNDPSNVDPANLSIGTQKANLKHMRDEGRDRPRGVDQEPDVKKASANLPALAKSTIRMAQAKLKMPKVAWAAFMEEVEGAFR